MRHNQHFSAALMVLSLLFSSALWAADRIAVMDFDNRTPHGGWRVGQGASDMLATALVKRTKFSVIERDKLANVIQEQNLSNDPTRFDASTAAEIGRLLGAQYMVTGAVTEYGRAKQGGSALGVSLGKQDYSAAVDIRIVDVNTGEIVFAESGSDSESSLSLKGFGMSAGESFDEKKATEAMRGAIKKVAKKIGKAKFESRHVAQEKPSGPVMVADVDGNIITLNKGTSAGFEVGQELTVSRKDKEIKDPETGAVIKIKYKEVGKIKLIEVDSGYAEGEVISGGGFEVKDVIR
ncbi:MAG: CsgG/HfaB family protein [Pseudomonadota bacterium]